MMRVLVVEDNALLRHHLKVQLQDSGHQVDAAEDAREADYYLNEHLPDIAIVDLGLPDEDGLSLILNNGKVVSKDSLMLQLYPDAELRESHTIDVLMGRLRKKIQGPVSARCHYHRTRTRISF